VLYRDDELNRPMIDRHWPHQVALPANRCHGHNFLTMRLFCEVLSLFPSTHSLRSDDQDKIVFSFAKHAHAEKFRERFGGEKPNVQIGPDCERPVLNSVWRIVSATAAASIAPTELDVFSGSLQPK